MKFHPGQPQNPPTMETVMNAANQPGAVDELAGQPWYVRWGLAALGTLAGFICILSAIGDLFGSTIIAASLQIAVGVLLIAFEATALAGIFKWAFCDVLIDYSKKCPPLFRAIIYGGSAVPIILLYANVFHIFVLLPSIATGAAYFVLWMDSRRKSDEEPIADDFA